MIQRAIVARAVRRPVTGLWITALLSALAVCLLVGSTVLFHPMRSAVGINPASDFQVMTWSLEWWPWAIQHGADPLHTRLLWPPEGFSTLWMTTIPAPALFALPVTLTAGPLLAYNLLMLAAVPLASAAAYLLCRELTGRFGPSLVGGLLFGLSPYMLGHTLSQHLDLTFVFPIPLLALVVIRYVRGKTSRRRFVAGFAALLLLQLGASFELFVDLGLLVALGFALALLRNPAQRGLVLRTGGLVGLAYAVCLPVLVPVALLALSQSHGPLRYAPSDFAIDLANVVVPTPTTLAGTFHSARAVSRHFVGNIGEQDGYLGVPLLIVALLALRGERRRGAWLLGGLFLVTALLSFGPVLTVAGRPLVPLPLSTASLPLVHDALPARWSMFTALGTACLVALWLARPHRRRIQWGVSGLLVLSLLPNFWPQSRLAGAWATSAAFGWSSPHVSPGFADDRAWIRLVKPGSVVLVLPTADRTAASYWEARAGMKFALAVPATPFAPPQIAAEPTVSGLVADNLQSLGGSALASARLRAFLHAEHVGAVAVVRGAGRRWRRIAANATAARPVNLDGTSVYRVSSTLPPLRATGDVVVAHASRQDSKRRRRLPSVSAWVRFDGQHAVVRVHYTWERPLTLSTTGDAHATAAAVDNRGRAAVAFVEWRNHEELLRVSSRAHGQWRTNTLDRNAEPIWSPHVVITSNGTTIAAWIDEADPLRLIRVAVMPPGGGWRQPADVETGEGFGNLVLGAGPDNLVVCAWRDSVAVEERIRVATYDGRAWTMATTVATSLSRLGRIELSGPNASLLRWRLEDPLTPGSTTFIAKRNGTHWTDLGRQPSTAERRIGRPS